MKSKSYLVIMLWLAAIEVLLFVGFSVTGEPGKPFTFGEWFWLVIIPAIMIYVVYRRFKTPDQIVNESKFKEAVQCRK